MNILNGETVSQGRVYTHTVPICISHLKGAVSSEGWRSWADLTVIALLSSSAHQWYPQWGPTGQKLGRAAELSTAGLQGQRPPSSAERYSVGTQNGIQGHHNE